MNNNKCGSTGCGCGCGGSDDEAGVSSPAELFALIEPWLEDEPCRSCDCLQGALAQIVMDGPPDLAHTVAGYRVSSDEMHPCLGCDTCPPAEAWTKYLSKPNTS